MSASGPSNREIEIKLRLRDAGEGRRLLERNGFEISKPRLFEANLVLDTADGQLRVLGCLLRLREAGRATVLTLKGPASTGRHKSREELEIETSSAVLTAEIFARLGFRPVFRYEKYRTEYSEPGQAGTAMLDETPIGDFLELEGTAAWIDATAARFGFAEADYITSSYADLYFAQCAQQGTPPGNLVFPRAGL